MAVTLTPTGVVPSNEYVFLNVTQGDSDLIIFLIVMMGGAGIVASVTISALSLLCGARWMRGRKMVYRLNAISRNPVNPRIDAVSEEDQSSPIPNRRILCMQSPPALQTQSASVLDVVMALHTGRNLCYPAAASRTPSPPIRDSAGVILLDQPPPCTIPPPPPVLHNPWSPPPERVHMQRIGSVSCPPSAPAGSVGADAHTSRPVAGLYAPLLTQARAHSHTEDVWVQTGAIGACADVATPPVRSVRATMTAAARIMAGSGSGPCECAHGDAAVDVVVEGALRGSAAQHSSCHRATDTAGAHSLTDSWRMRDALRTPRSLPPACVACMPCTSCMPNACVCTRTPHDAGCLRRVEHPFSPSSVPSNRSASRRRWDAEVAAFVHTQALMEAAADVDGGCEVDDDRLELWARKRRQLIAATARHVVPSSSSSTSRPVGGMAAHASTGVSRPLLSHPMASSDSDNAPPVSEFVQGGIGDVYLAPRHTSSDTSGHAVNLAPAAVSRPSEHHPLASERVGRFTRSEAAPYRDHTEGVADGASDASGGVRPLVATGGAAHVPKQRLARARRALPKQGEGHGHPLGDGAEAQHHGPDAPLHAPSAGAGALLAPVSVVPPRVWRGVAVATKCGATNPTPAALLQPVQMAARQHHFGAYEDEYVSDDDVGVAALAPTSASHRVVGLASHAAGRTRSIGRNFVMPDVHARMSPRGSDTCPVAPVAVGLAASEADTAAALASLAVQRITAAAAAGLISAASFPTEATLRKGTQLLSTFMSPTDGDVWTRDDMSERGGCGGDPVDARAFGALGPFEKHSEPFRPSGPHDAAGMFVHTRGPSSSPPVDVVMPRSKGGISVAHAADVHPPRLPLPLPVYTGLSPSLPPDSADARASAASVPLPISLPSNQQLRAMLRNNYS